MEVGDGSRCRVWLDPWLQGGPILEQGGFSIASAWEAIRPRGGRVRWAGLLWGRGNIPKHSFCAWLAIKDRGCGVSRSLVLFVSVRGDVWSRGIGKGVRRKLWRVLWCATIYFIWNERNHRLHGGQARDPNVLFHLIYKESHLEVVSVMMADVTTEAAVTEIDRKINFFMKAVEEQDHEIAALKDQMKACETFESSKTPTIKADTKEKLCCRKIRCNSSSLSPPCQYNSCKI
ncbi:ty3-gypsy retrotransposon protein [Cucumis melo var. makuwa]|uniref:Ty3-gypsy retrotransposon protein n=1 Tax=Cucumis melo var. makuwa TaxID=1194695 RepID=A0A5D3BMM7_CUCMM|nr:ty3-gypsy retrotransposon protein [Cucumis melo var. makuwa]